MEDQAEESLDGSSIKPVSSLRSHFEQMAKPPAKVTAIPPARPISPKPKTQELTAAKTAVPSSGLSGQPTLRPPSSDIFANSLPSVDAIRQRPTFVGPVSSPLLPPAVTIEPPSSPPKSLNLNLALANPSLFLTADESRTTSTSTSGASSPRHFRIPSRPHTPLLEPRRSASSTPHAQPPEPPPPRRSGELRREAPSKISMGPPPPVNRTEKPKISSKQTFLATTVEPLASNYNSAIHDPPDRASPFSTPPSSGSSPEYDPVPPQVPRARIGSAEMNSRPRPPNLLSDPPPIHHFPVNRRRDPEQEPWRRNAISPQVTNDLKEQRPALPVRPSANPSSTSFKSSEDMPRANRAPVPPIDIVKSSKLPAESSNNFLTPPKRNFSTPNSQVQTPHRTHGRSMTVDQASDRVPSEFRIAKVSSIAVDTTRSAATLQPLAMSDDSIIPIQADYPNTSHSNRRPPQIKRGPPDISTKFDTRIIDVCGKYVCSSGYTTKVWSLIDGEQVVNIPHGETIKILSMSFKPATRPEDEGLVLWLGNNFGELLEIEIASQTPIVATNNIAHARREINKIHRHINEMWTLDDSGTLNVWGPNGKGTPNLESPSASYRVPKLATFSIVVEDELWHATGSDIRVFLPTVDGRNQFQVLQRPLSQSGVGDVTSGALIGNQVDRVYFGHSDGKVSIYSRQSYACLGTVNVSMYKINALAGVGDFLWAAYNTGMIYIYDTAHDPWMVKKDWRAHVNPVINIVADRSSLWKLDRLQVVSLGADSVIRTWDGLLEDDWLEAEMQSQDKKFCEFEQIRTLVMTWNAGASTPHSLRYAEQDAAFFPDLLKQSNTPDILVFGFQELVDLEDKKNTAKSYFSKSKKKDPSEQEHMSRQYRDWRDYLIRCLDDSTPGDELYHLLHSSSLLGLFTCVFVRNRLRSRIKGVSGGEVKRGMGGRIGNKGALILRFMVDDTSMCFINCHLAAGQTQTKYRNLDVSEILDSTILPLERDPAVRLDSYVGGGDGTMILDHEICVLNGDLNYRIDTMSRDAVINALKAGNIGKLLERDQLLASRRRRPGFRLRAFYEMPITFAPTYKYDVGTDTYDSSEKRRAPAWCDRILSRGRDPQRLEQLDYRRHEVRVSDHRPVTGLFRMTTKSISPQRRAIVWEDSRRKFEDVKQKLATKSMLDFLSNVCGLDSKTSHEMLKRSRSSRS